MSTFRSARTIWELLDGEVTNLSMQKLLFISHMLFLVSNKKPLVSRLFEAWDYGPVEPDLYHKLKAYGSNYVPNVLSSEPYVDNDVEFCSISEVIKNLGKVKPSTLVHITHWDGGAWSKHYVPNMKNIVIPDQDIVEEYYNIVRRAPTGRPQKVTEGFAGANIGT